MENPTTTESAAAYRVYLDAIRAGRIADGKCVECNDDYYPIVSDGYCAGCA